MKLVVENSEDDLKKRAAGEDFDSALEAASINLLRVIAGAGNPERVIRQLDDCLAAAAVYREAHGEYPDRHGIAALLNIERHDEQERRSWSPEDRERWDSNGESTMMEAALAIRRASLRVVAGQWSGHKAVLSNAERSFFDAVNSYFEARDFRRRQASGKRR